MTAISPLRRWSLAVARPWRPLTSQGGGKAPPGAWSVVAAVMAGVLVTSLASPAGDLLASMEFHWSMLAGMVVTGLLAAAILEARHDTLRIVLVTIILATMAEVFLDQLTERQIHGRVWIGAAVSVSLLVTLLLPRMANAGSWRRVTSVLVVFVAFVSTIIPESVLAELQPDATDAAAPYPYRRVDHETVWAAQPSRVAGALKTLNQAPATRFRVIAVGADGTQAIFKREAEALGASLAQRLGAGTRRAVLVNGADDDDARPLASTTNLAAMLGGMAKAASPDIVTVLYLTSHGSRGAELATVLPDAFELQPIGARWLRQALDEARIGPRIIIISACFSGSWIPLLASPDTIIMTAAAADRTSFGCDDRRSLTVFGEAFQTALQGNHASLRETFAAARAIVADKDRQFDGPPSNPQLFVGERMTRLWAEPLAPAR